jgi:hypothetical protein
MARPTCLQGSGLREQNRAGGRLRNATITVGEVEAVVGVLIAVQVNAAGRATGRASAGRRRHGPSSACSAGYVYEPRHGHDPFCTGEPVGILQYSLKKSIMKSLASLGHIQAGQTAVCLQMTWTGIDGAGVSVGHACRSWPVCYYRSAHTTLIEGRMAGHAGRAFGLWRRRTWPANRQRP